MTFSLPCTGTGGCWQHLHLREPCGAVPTRIVSQPCERWNSTSPDPASQLGRGVASHCRMGVCAGVCRREDMLGTVVNTLVCACSPSGAGRATASVSTPTQVLPCSQHPQRMRRRASRKEVSSLPSCPAVPLHALAQYHTNVQGHSSRSCCTHRPGSQSGSSAHASNCCSAPHAGPYAPVTPTPNTAPVPVCAAKQHGDDEDQQAAQGPSLSDQPPVSDAPETRASRSRARRAQKEGQPVVDAGTMETPAKAASAPAAAVPPQPATLDASTSVDNGGKPARAVSGAISQAAIGTAQPLLIRIKQDPGVDGSAQPQSTLPILPLTTGPSGAATPAGGGGSAEAGKAAGGGGSASAQPRRSGRSTRKEGKAAGGSGGSSPAPATTPSPAAPSGAPPAPAVGGVSRTVTSLSHGGRPAGPAISSPRDLQVQISRLPC